MNLLTNEEIATLIKKYCPTDEAYKFVSEHGEIVWEIAEWCAGNADEDVDLDVLRVACKLHDIGSPAFIAASRFDDEYRFLYGLHSMLGEIILRDEGLPKEVYEIVGTHNLMGMTKNEIIENKFALPHQDRHPSSIEGELLCYADRFHSKHPKFNDHRDFKGFYGLKVPVQEKKFHEAVKKFGMPDLDALAKKWDHPIK
ncbi:MAG: HD domain-containing protein [bacterium]|nr:HD domain-containing protein [bacterium]